MTIDKVELEFVADTSGVDQGFSKVDSGLKDLDGTVRKTSESVSGFFSVFAGSFAAGAVSGALSQLTQAFGQLPEVIARGAQIDDIAASFDNLAAKAGVSGDALINGFSKALGDTIPKIDLMKQANELLNGNIDPSKFNDLAGAARSLAEVTGGSASEGLEKLSDALLRGRTMGLKAIGVIVDNEAAVKKYAASLGVTTEALGAEDQIEAIRIATLDALAKKRGELAVVEDDAADKIDQMKASIQNQTDEVLRNIANNEDLNEVLGRLATAISSLELKELAGDLITVASATARFTVAVGEALAKGLQFVPIIKSMRESTSALRETLSGGAFLINFFKTDGKENQALALSRALKDMGINFKGAGAAAGQFSAGVNQASDAQGKINKATEDGVKRIKEAQAALDGHKSALEKKKKAEQDATEAVKKAEAEEKKRNEQLLAASNAIAKLTLDSDKYNNVLDDLRDGTIDNVTAGQKMAQLYIDTKRVVDDLASSEQILNALLYAQSKGANVAAKDIADLSEKIAQLKTEKDSLTKSSSSGASGQKNGDFLSGLLGNFSAAGTEGQSGAELAGQQLGAALLDGLARALSGEKLSKTEIGQTIGGGIGGAIGAYFGGPAGAQIGATLGSAIGGGLAEAFGSRDTQGKVRDSLDRMFIDILKDNPLQAIINGQLSTIKDLDFFRGSDAFDTGAFDDTLQSLSSTAQQAFGGIAESFSEVFGQGSELASQLAAVLADNLGGSLNNLQLLVEATGVSFEELKSATVEAFLDGKLSALEAQSALQGIQQIAEKGIPGSLGDVSLAFDNMKAAGTKGGRALIDGLQDIGFEAKKLGQKDLTQVVTSLAATGKYSAAEIQQVFDALKAAGITTVDQLTAATTEQLLPVLAELENTKFPFAQQTEEIREYAKAFSEIPDSKDVEIRVKVKYDSPADQAVVQNVTSGNRPAGLGTVQL